jgi:putative endonuclease
MSGARSYLKGMAAEEQVCLLYLKNGFEILHRRWRTREGEIDLIARHDNRIYFVEVKHSKTFERAAESLLGRQKARIRAAALAFLASLTDRLDVDCRFDAALVDGSGKIRVLPNAF